jgi:5-methylcytosine-specific restriction endonuclease McrA
VQTWLHKARSLPKDFVQREVEKELTGRESEPWETIYFKLSKTQIPIVEQAIETAALMLGTDKSGYCLEMICADFLAGRTSRMRTQPCSSSPCRGSSSFCWRTTPGSSARSDRESVVKRIRPTRPRLRLDPEPYDQPRKQVLRRDGWRCQLCGSGQNLHVQHKGLRSQQGDDELNLITLCAGCHKALHRRVEHLWLEH